MGDFDHSRHAAGQRLLFARSGRPGVDVKRTLRIGPRRSQLGRKRAFLRGSEKHGCARSGLRRTRSRMSHEGRRADFFAPDFSTIRSWACGRHGAGQLEDIRGGRMRKEILVGQRIRLRMFSVAT